ncbi:hypothetical protein B0H12DRAFT_1236065 [Mycena haematopus]|nr:hypothetical protein B0H12DRAFT_1236065 [Mycena haematopus]
MSVDTRKLRPRDSQTSAHRFGRLVYKRCDATYRFSHSRPLSLLTLSPLLLDCPSFFPSGGPPFRSSQLHLRDDPGPLGDLGDLYLVLPIRTARAPIPGSAAMSLQISHHPAALVFNDELRLANYHFSLSRLVRRSTPQLSFKITPAGTEFLSGFILFVEVTSR